MLTNKEDNIIELSWIVNNAFHDGKMKDYKQSFFKQLIVNTADKFEKDYKNVDWCELNYFEEIEKYGNLMLAKVLWRDFEDVSMNLETESIDEEWNGFPVGTYKLDIWHWFEEKFNVSVGKHLMKLES